MKVLQYIITSSCILSPSQLTNDMLDSHQFHYYMVVSYPTQYIIDCYGKDGTIAFLLSDGTNETEVIIPKQGNYSIENISFEFKDLSHTSANVSYSCVFPDGTIINRTNEYGGSMVYLYANKTIDLRIEYIGQSYANDGHGTAQKRLSNHSTLQKILCEYRCTSNQREILLILLTAEILPIDNTILMGYPSPIVLIGNIDHPDYVNLLEACLINQFKPKFNIIYKKGTVPTIKHTVYDEVLKENYDSFAINVAIYYGKFHLRLYTDAKSVEINKGVLSEKDRLYMNFKDALLINEDQFFYSFYDTTIIPDNP